MGEAGAEEVELEVTSWSGAAGGPLASADACRSLVTTSSAGRPVMPEGGRRVTRRQQGHATLLLGGRTGSRCRHLVQNVCRHDNVRGSSKRSRQMGQQMASSQKSAAVAAALSAGVPLMSVMLLDRRQASQFPHTMQCNPSKRNW